MAKNYSIFATIKGKDEASSVFKRVARNASASARGIASGISGTLGRLSSGLTSLPVVGGLLGGGLGLSGLVEWVGEFAKAGDLIAKTSRQAGVSTKTFQELAYAAGLSGVSAEEFALAMKTANRGLGDLKANRGPLKELLSKVAPQLMRALKTAPDTEAALAGVFEALASIKDPAKRATLAQAAFGEAGIKMALMVENGTEALRAQRKEFADLGGVMSNETLKATEDYNDALSRLGVAWSGLKNVFGAAFVKTALPWLDKLTSWFKDNQGRLGDMAAGFARDLVGGIKSFVAAVPEMVSALKTIAVVLGGIARLVSNITGGLGGWVGILIKGDAKKEVGGLFRGAQALAAAGVGGPGPVDAAAFSKSLERQDAFGPAAALRRGATGNAGAVMAWAARNAAFARLGSAGIAGKSEVVVRFENAPSGARVEARGDNPPKLEVGRRRQGVQ